MQSAYLAIFKNEDFFSSAVCGNMQHKGKKDILGVLLKPQVFGKVEAVGVLLDAPSRETPFQGPPA